LGRITAPTLVVHGVQDGFVPWPSHKASLRPAWWTWNLRRTWRSSNDPMRRASSWRLTSATCRNPRRSRRVPERARSSSGSRI
jgi:hypothetical protein